MSTPVPRCSVVSAEVGELLAGSAPQAVAWVALEQSGPWGAHAFTQSHLDPAVGAAIESAASSYGVRPCLIRRTGRHADEDAGTDRARHVLVAFPAPGRTWLLEGTVADPADLLLLDWAALAAGDAEGVQRSLPELSRTDRVHLLVCTNGTRDLCCAAYGRPVATVVAKGHPEQVWETTHTSGHRFAPTAVLLPHGTLHGRLSADSATALVEAAHEGRTLLVGSRGRSCWPAAAQVAELVVREETGELGLDSLSVTAHQDHEGGAVSTVTHLDGRSWQVRTELRPSDVRRSESCGKDPVPMSTAVVTALTQLS